MTEIINNPGSGNGGGGGLVAGVIISIVIIVLFFMYGLPALRNKNQTGTNINVTIPANNGTTQPAP